MLVPLAEQDGEDVLADAIPPKVVAAIAAREPASVQVHPVGLAAAPHLVPAAADATDAERERAFEPCGIDAAGGAGVPVRVVAPAGPHDATSNILAMRDLHPVSGVTPGAVAVSARGRRAVSVVRSGLTRAGFVVIYKRTCLLTRLRSTDGSDGARAGPLVEAGRSGDAHCRGHVTALTG